MQDLSVFNSLTGKKEKFTTFRKDVVHMYVCGPTVYSNVHLGNVRTFMSFDIIYRYLKHLDFKVRYVRNITDVGHLQGDEDDGKGKVNFAQFFIHHASVHFGKPKVRSSEDR